MEIKKYVFMKKKIFYKKLSYSWGKMICEKIKVLIN